MRSECQLVLVHSVNSLALACFQVAKFLEAVFLCNSDHMVEASLRRGFARGRGIPYNAALDPARVELP